MVKGLTLHALVVVRSWRLGYWSKALMQPEHAQGVEHFYKSFGLKISALGQYQYEWSRAFGLGAS